MKQGEKNFLKKEKNPQTTNNTGILPARDAER